MPKYVHPDVIDNGLQHIIDQAAGNVDMLLIKAYAQGDSHATVVGNQVATINTVAGDYVLGNSGTYDRKLTVSGQTGTASGNAPSPDLHVAIVDTTNSDVLAVTDETTDQVITSGNPITIPTFDIIITQPT